MICEELPRLVPFRITLQGSEDSTQTIEPKIIIDTDLENLTILPKDLRASHDYLMAVVSLIIDDGSTQKKLKVQAWHDLGSFDMDLLDISFNWTDQFIDIWCETYISVDTLQMSEDYSISIPDEYLDMIGKTEKTYIIQSGEINYGIVVDEREVEQDAAEEASNVLSAESPEEQEREDMAKEERDIADQKEEQENKRQSDEDKARYYRELEAQEAQAEKEAQERQADLDAEKQREQQWEDQNEMERQREETSRGYR